MAEKSNHLSEAKAHEGLWEAQLDSGGSELWEAPGGSGRRGDSIRLGRVGALGGLGMLGEAAGGSGRLQEAVKQGEFAL